MLHSKKTQPGIRLQRVRRAHWVPRVPQPGPEDLSVVISKQLKTWFLTSAGVTSWQLLSPYRDGQLHQGGVLRSSCCCTQKKPSRAQNCSECGEPTGRREIPNRGRKDSVSSFRNTPNLVPDLCDIARFARVCPTWSATTKAGHVEREAVDENAASPTAFIVMHDQNTGQLSFWTAGLPSQPSGIDRQLAATCRRQLP